MRKPRIKGGLYIVVDPNMKTQKLRYALESALRSQVISAIQIWDHWDGSIPPAGKLTDICQLAQTNGVPVLINNQWELLDDYPFDGVHFDSLPDDIITIKQRIARPIITGVTLSNDIRLLSHIHAREIDYLSFCSMFPSASVSNCEIVRPSVVRKARSLVDVPLFLAGGIRLDNLPKLADLPYDGIAVISGIMSHENPEQAALALKESIKTIKSDKR